MAGTLLSQSTPEFTEILNTATLVISKGQGNLETLSEEIWNIPLFYLLLSKCDHISQRAGIKPFDLILLDHQNYSKTF